MVKEIWEIIDGHPDYAISTHGRVESFDRDVKWKSRWGTIGTRRMKGRMLKAVDAGQYLVVHLGDPSVNHSIHRLVASTFLEPPEDGFIVNHKDGNKLNNLVTNLEWVSAKTNTQHSYTNGLKKSSKLTADTVRELRARAKRGEHIKAIAADYGITHTYASKVRDGKNWGWIE